ncbi:hypothetical protein OEG92_13450 [Polaribacter sejongensis]|uniref:hypothetical protein n=1 Tax=Polaribacter sejongensis TaxID=985043 RepID=UPI0035A6FB45
MLKSYDRRKPERIKDAIDAYDKLKRNYPESQFMEDSNIMLATLQKEQVRIDALIAKQVEVQNSKKK